MSDENKNNFDCSTFIRFATSLEKPIRLNCFSKVDSDTISWNRQSLYGCSHMYIDIILINEDADFTKYHFSLILHNGGNTFLVILDGQTPQECVDKLNAEIDKCVSREKTKKDIWEKFRF